MTQSGLSCSSDPEVFIDTMRPTRSSGLSGMSPFARATICSLGLEAHPEGGWYRRTWQSPRAIGRSEASSSGEHGAADETRPLASLIYFLLPAGDVSAWHVVDADEIWLWHGPGRVVLELGGSGDAPSETEAMRVTLGLHAEGAEDGSCTKHGEGADEGLRAERANDADDGARSATQLVIPAGTWQRTIPSPEDVLCSCVVSPGFVYAGFTLSDAYASDGS